MIKKVFDALWKEKYKQTYSIHFYSKNSRSLVNYIFSSD